MKTEHIRLGKGSLTDNIYAGQLSKDKKRWLSKKDVTSDFLKAVIERWRNTFQVITAPNGVKYRIDVVASNCCPYCYAPLDKIKECHPFSSDAGAYFVCDVCNARFEPNEYEELEDEE